MLSSGNSVRRGSINDNASMLRGSREIDVINPHPSASNNTETASRGLEDLASDLGATADDQGIAEGDLGAKLLLGEVVGAVDVGEVFEEFKPSLAELLGDEDGGLGTKGGGVRGYRDAAAAGAEGEAEGRGKEGKAVAGVGAGGGGEEAVGWSRDGCHFGL